MIIIIIRIISILVVGGFILTTWSIRPNAFLTEFSSYASIIIGIIGLHITFETFTLARTIKEQRSSTSLKQTLASIINELSEKITETPQKEDISRINTFATLLEKNKSISSDSEVKSCIQIMKGYKKEYPESNREIIDVLNQIQSIIV